MTGRQSGGGRWVLPVMGSLPIPETDCDVTLTLLKGAPPSLTLFLMALKVKVVESLQGFMH